ncbi:MAG: polymer-forming cytoskeletal protein [Sphingobium sp.]
MFSKSSKSQSNASHGSQQKSARAANAAKSTFSIIGSDVSITGDIKASADLHIDGRVEGDIVCAALVQGVESHIKGRIEARSVRLAGHVEGSIDATDLVIEESARIVGDISYDSIAVSPGAHVDGRFAHKGGVQTGADLKLVQNQDSINA